jgi:hypothetical protein
MEALAGSDWWLDAKIYEHRRNLAMATKKGQGTPVSDPRETEELANASNRKARRSVAGEEGQASHAEPT